MVSAVTIAQLNVPMFQYVMPLELAALETELAIYHASHAHLQPVTIHHHATTVPESVIPSECVSTLKLQMELPAMTQICALLEITALLEIALETPPQFAHLLTLAMIPVFATLRLEIAQILPQPTGHSAMTTTNARHWMFAFLVSAQENIMFSAMPQIPATKLEPAIPSQEYAPTQPPITQNHARMETFAQQMICVLKDTVLECQ